MGELRLNHLQHVSSDISPRLADDLGKLQDAINRIARQTNANPTALKIDPPPKISAVAVSQLQPGVAKVVVTDNSPVQRGVWYHFEASTTHDFQVGTTILSGTQQSRVHLAPVGGGALYWRAYSQYLTSDPSEPVAASGSFDAGGSARTGNLSGTGSGTEPSQQAQPGAGFGFTGERGPRLPQ